MSLFQCNFYCAAALSRTDHIRGGTIIFVHKNVYAKQLDISEYCLEFHFEICAIADKLKLMVESLYHSTAGNSDIFLQNLDELLTFLCHWSSYTVVIGGDVNISFDITSQKKYSQNFTHHFMTTQLLLPKWITHTRQSLPCQRIRQLSF